MYFEKKIRFTVFCYQHHQNSSVGITIIVIILQEIWTTIMHHILLTRFKAHYYVRPLIFFFPRSLQICRSQIAHLSVHSCINFIQKKKDKFNGWYVLLAHSAQIMQTVLSWSPITYMPIFLSSKPTIFTLFKKVMSFFKKFK